MGLIQRIQRTPKPHARYRRKANPGETHDEYAFGVQIAPLLRELDRRAWAHAAAKKKLENEQAMYELLTPKEGAPPAPMQWNPMERRIAFGSTGFLALYMSLYGSGILSV